MKCKPRLLLLAVVLFLFTGAVTMSGPSDNKQRAISKASLAASAAANYDTLTTGVISLAVATNGKFGGGDSAGLSGVRMD